MKEHLINACNNTPGPSATGNSSLSAVGGPSVLGSSTVQMSPDLDQARGSSSPRHVSGAMYLSSRNTKHPHLTPRTRSLYHFSETPGSTTSGTLRDCNHVLHPAGSSDVAANALAQLSSVVSMPDYHCPCPMVGSTECGRLFSALLRDLWPAFPGRRQVRHLRCMGAQTVSRNAV